MKKLFLLLVVAAASVVARAQQPVADLLDRIGGAGTSERIATQLDATLAGETFVITADAGRPLIKGSTLSAITVGLNWYLNHYAHVNLTWNNLTTDLSQVDLPLPAAEERHTTDADYRYYLNYCTFCYSMTTWDWQRWQQEIDWMALHGINMPLQIVGLEKVWRQFLIEDCGYTEADAEAFVAGPAFVAWWGMNNLEGWGGTTDDAWYDYRADLGRRICDRERELGIEPVLPGFSGMVPSNFTQKTGNPTERANQWCRFQRPYILDPTSDCFATLAAKYYAQLGKVMGESRYFSMDPFHEGGTISSGKYAEGYRAIYDAMNAYAGSTSKWVIQQWQWANYQRNSLTAVPDGRLIVLDLFSDGRPAFDSYNGYTPQEAVYCAIPNFGGRTGFFGRLPKMADNYFTYKQKYKTIKGIGAAPEAIEQTPVVYDLLFELPWMGRKPDTKAWMEQYVEARYGAAPQAAVEAWEALRQTALNNTTQLQGPHEAIVCARPALTVNKVSTWGGTDIFYKDDLQQFIAATYKLLSVAPDIPNQPAAQQNLSYDLTDITRQTLTDYASKLLDGIRTTASNTRSVNYQSRRTAFLNLILDLDSLLATNRMFRLGNWTETARRAAADVPGSTAETLDWYELENARTLITTWGDQTQAEAGGLRDYSYREWQGMLRDYYYPRWRYFFDHSHQAPSAGWFFTEWNWAHELQGEVGASAKGTQMKAQRTYYTAAPEGETADVARRVLARHILPLCLPSGTTHYAYRHLITNLLSQTVDTAYLGQPYTPRFVDPAEQGVIYIDLNANGTYDDDEVFDLPLVNIPATATPGPTKAKLVLTDATTVSLGFLIEVPDAVAAPQAKGREARTYDLQGRPAESTRPGLYITDGRKIAKRA